MYGARHVGTTPAHSQDTTQINSQRPMSYTLENITIGDSSFHPENEDEAAALDAAYAQYREAVKDWDTFAPMILTDHEGQEADAQYDELLNDLATEVRAAAEVKGVHRFSDRLLTAVKDTLTTRIPL